MKEVQKKMSVKVNINSKQKEIKLPTGTRLLIRKACNATLNFENFNDSAEVDVTLVDDDEIKALNSFHRKIDKSTDVLSFPLGQDGIYDVNPETGAKLLGDIVISLERADEQAQAFGHSLRREIGFLTVHSMFHLLGYDHEEGLEAVRMREKEETVLSRLGLVRDASYVMEE